MRSFFAHVLVYVTFRTPRHKLPITTDLLILEAHGRGNLKPSSEDQAISLDNSRATMERQGIATDLVLCSKVDSLITSIFEMADAMDERLALDRKHEDEIGRRYEKRRAARGVEKRKERGEVVATGMEEQMDAGAVNKINNGDAVAAVGDGGKEATKSSPGARRTTRSVSQATEAVGLNWEVELDENDLTVGNDGDGALGDKGRRPATPTVPSTSCRSSPSYARRALEEYGRILVAYYVSFVCMWSILAI